MGFKAQSKAQILLLLSYQQNMELTSRFEAFTYSTLYSLVVIFFAFFQKKFHQAKNLAFLNTHF